MKRSVYSLRKQIILTVILGMLLIWIGTFYELYRSRINVVQEAQVRTEVRAQVFAEYSRSSVKRINEFILDIRNYWTGNRTEFSLAVDRAQENIADLSFQVAVIDANGFLAYSNLQESFERTDLSEREHFLVHKNKDGADEIFISKPIKGKVSGKWSIQVTRPIYKKGGKFDGVLVVSVSPDQFTRFAQRLGFENGESLTVVRDSGEILARFPDMPNSLGMVLTGRPFLGSQARLSGSFSETAAVDGVDRIFGFYRLPEYGLIFVLGESLNRVLEPYALHRNVILVSAAVITVLAIVLFFVLFKSLAALEMAQQQLDTIIVLSPDGFVTFDAYRRVKFVNPSFERLTGFRKADVEGMDEQSFEARLASLCEPRSVLPKMIQLREQLTPSPGEKTTKTRCLIELSKPKGRVLELELRVNFSNFISQILYLRDVTFETEVNRMKSEFLSTAAHELRTPMASIYGFSELLLQQEFDEPTKRELLSSIHRQSEKMTSILNELLDLAIIEAGQGKDFLFGSINLIEVVQEVLSLFKYPKGRVQPILINPQSSLYVFADKQKLEQVLTNLISNAYKYSSSGEITISYKVKSDNMGQWFGIEVGDSGIGMSPEQKVRIFDRFYRADSSGASSGTGLGMSITKEIIDLHHGEIEIQTALGSGTKVTIWLLEYKIDRMDQL